MVVSGVDDAFPFALVQAARDLNADPVDLANVLYSESGIRPWIINSIGCVGENQFCASSGRDTLPGWPGVAAYAKLSASQQLTNFVAPWWKKLKVQHGITGRLTGRDLYWLNFLPAFYKPNVDASYVITRDPSYVAQNPGFSNGKSYIAAGDIDRALVQARQVEPARWAAIERAIRDAEQADAPDNPYINASFHPGVATSTTTSAGGVTGSVALAAGIGFLAWYAAKQWGKA